MQLNRRQFVHQATAGISSSILGLGWLDQLIAQEVRGETLANTRQYDAAMMIFYDGGPSQADSFDAKPDGTGNRYPTVRIPGVSDLYGEPIHFASLIENLAALVGPQRQRGLGRIKMGLIRSMHHGIPVHQFAQKFTTGFWQSPVGFNYPPAAAVMAHYFRDHASATGLPGSVFLRGETGRDANSTRGAQVPLALEVNGRPEGIALMPELLQTKHPSSYRRRRELIDVFSRAFATGRPESEITGWKTAVDQAVELTLKGVAADAFKLDSKNLLAANNPHISLAWKQRVSLATQLVKAGVPFVNLGIGGNDEGHTNNTAAVERIFGQATNHLVCDMLLDLEAWCVAENKRVLVFMGGEFGRTPHNVVNKDGYDTREHWASGFTWNLVSINHPTFKNTAIGDTGPDGDYTLADGSLRDPVRPSAIGGLLYTVMGFPPTDPQFHIDTTVGRRAPVDMAWVKPQSPDGYFEGNTPWLMEKLGLSV